MHQHEYAYGMAKVSARSTSVGIERRMEVS